MALFEIILWVILGLVVLFIREVRRPKPPENPVLRTKWILEQQDKNIKETIRKYGKKW